jgi:hypothetical protein
MEQARIILISGLVPLKSESFVHEAMHEIANDCRTLLDKSGAVAPTLHQLCGAIDGYLAQRKTAGAG